MARVFITICVIAWAATAYGDFDWGRFYAPGSSEAKLDAECRGYLWESCHKLGLYHQRAKDLKAAWMLFSIACHVGKHKPSCRPYAAVRRKLGNPPHPIIVPPV